MTNKLTPLMFLLFFGFLGVNTLVAQNSEISISTNIEQFKGYENNIYIAIDGNELTEQKKKTLKEAGVTFKGEYNDGSTIISIANKNSSVLEAANLTFHKIDNHLKISDELQYSGQTEIAITFHDELTKETIANIKNDFGISDNKFTAPSTQILIGKIDGSQLESLALLPEVAYISALVEEPEPLSDDAISFHHAKAITSSTGLNLKGTDMVVGLGDGGELGEHIDLEGRIINVANGTFSSYYDHADKMAGIIAGGGIIDDRYTGYAPKATLVTEKTFRIFYYMENYYTNHGMRLTNNSYGSSFSCTTSGAYDYYSIMMDQQMVDYEDALHIVAVGNSGGHTCNDYPLSYKTVLKTYASAKNVLTVGGVLEDRSRNLISSCGPVADGRIKPEIMTLSENLATTNGNNNYSAIGGTSSATANATGATTLLYERYKQNTGENPKGALLKAILCNTADDAGNEGPDFQYGFGIMNIQQAIDNVDAGHYILGETETQTPNLTYKINVPAGENELKVLLTWSDLPQNINGAATLINDLDLSIIAPDGTTYLPWVLDHNAGGVTNLPTRNLDRINNIEQVTIDNPMEGIYTVVVNTFNLDSEKQKFAISHTTVGEKLNITFPIEGTTLGRNESILITWDAALDSVTEYLVEYSTDNETTWSTIGTAPAGSSKFTWTASNDANHVGVKIRVTAVGNGTVAESGRFNIMKTPENLSLNALCGSYIEFDWANTTDAESYEVFMYNEGKMISIATTTESEYLVETRMDAGVKYWFTVKAIFANDVKSRMARSTYVEGIDTYPCPFENDLELISMEAGEKKGREFTSKALLETQPIVVHVFNAGTNTITEIPMKYNINGEETVNTIPVEIAAGETYIHTTAGFDFSEAGNYDIQVLIDLPLDTHEELNDLNATCIQLGNEELVFPSFEYMDEASPFMLTENTLGVNSLPYLDFVTTNSSGHISLFDNGADFGNVLKANHASAVDSSEFIFTRNLGNVETTFIRMNYNVVPSSDSNVAFSIRASDTEDWIHVKDLEFTGEWLEESEVINISKIVNNEGFTFTTSTQFQFKLQGNVDMKLSEFSLLSESNFLPVELVSFDASQVEENVLLEWVTASELNNDYFEIQVAKGNEAFRSGDFITLGKVTGKGTTVEETLYVFNDMEDFKSGTRYYRLKQVDFDGTYSFSDVVPVNFDEESNINISLNVYPNPFVTGRNPNVYFELRNESEVKFILTDSAGRILMEINEMYPAGANSFTLDLDPDLEAGMYYLAAILEKNNEVVTKILKMND